MPQPLSPPSPVHVVQLTDAHLFADPAGTLLGLNTRASLGHVVGQVRREQPRIDLLLCTGDLSQDASKASYAAFREMTAVFGAPSRWLPGNHDEAQVMLAVAPELVQAVTDIGQWRIVMLDSAVVGATFGLLADDQLAMLDKALDDAGERHCLVCCHHQPVDIGCAWIKPIGLRNADALLLCIKRYPQVKALLWGHIHQEWDELHDGVRYLATPSTCIQFAPRSEDFKVSEEQPGYRWLRLHDDGRLETGVERAFDFEVKLDFDSPGY
ncbi:MULTISPECIES: 3',5'-cyclic-AMP phosphodiesterase [unclassified Pseudomonas]|uniref:3',5'-cyclic-AMP phosphodiesterase n=1 Tax=unclassified Pseudomonas TaxID=196821 RepID=UPI000C88762C|nr:MULTISPECIES: 3',5'-cyclic-AMP phosphodiesterase [unclassified Pseudomonas]PNA01656.1 3',5'-cyclic-AMP phosphodiesterase [Pseudomonas sp. FW305-42]PNA25607.1 3',5'-cyclic-AMP phosphodiesterase [Pseudomonas sp. MPR-R1B]PNB27130.1 3',5'-cyclic-AMP phosphodiesterase [Pseudomonas sp. DP16D-E2]PNB44516.1 3',5'-cyclic-AMP phosphodiesterase [Pseudomonas sp. FW305-17]PNB64744.1 3',5'-cyclic-AMP phosphodiesterase [Pseudomonas sp. GW531-E2]